MKPKPFLPALILTLVLTAPLRAMFAPLSTIPIERMVEDLQARREAEPENAQWTYRLGRVYYLAFEMGAAASFTYTPAEPGNEFPNEVMLGWSKMRLEHDLKSAEGGYYEIKDVGGEGAKWEIQVLTEAERIAYAEKAYDLLKQAVKQAPDQGLYALTLGSFEQNWIESGFAEPAALKPINQQSAMKAYEQAWRQLREEDLARKSLPVYGKSGLFSAEAAQAWMALEKKVASGENPEVRRQMEADLKKLSKLRMNMVTPLIFSFKPVTAVPVNPQATVSFDLVGDRSGGVWTWPKEGAAFLVWDPEGRGEIKSGRQLFGGYTWQMFWDNGFEPLQVLDTDKDGRLTGKELSGLSAWFDEAPLGVSSLEELIPLSQLGVKALHLQHESYPGPDALEWNRSGLELTDGSRHPVWDWLAEPLTD